MKKLWPRPYKLPLFWCLNVCRRTTVMWQESPWGAGLQGKGHHRIHMACLVKGFLREREQPCCWQSCPLLLLSTGLVHSSTGSSTLADERESDSASKGLCGHSHLSADQLCKSCGSLGVNCGNLSLVCAVEAMKLAVTCTSPYHSQSRDAGKYSLPVRRSF